MRNILLEIARMDPEAKQAIEALGRKCDGAERERDEAIRQRDEALKRVELWRQETGRSDNTAMRHKKNLDKAIRQRDEARVERDWAIEILRMVEEIQTIQDAHRVVKDALASIQEEE